MESEAAKNSSEWITNVTAILTLINVIATIVYVIVTIFIASFTKKATKISQEATRISQESTEISRKQLLKATELEENRLRPYVLFNIFSDDNGRTYSHIKNYGLTAALNVKVTISPKITIFDTDELDTLSTNPIGIMPPSYEIKSVLDSSPSFHNRYPESVFEGSIEYENNESRNFREIIKLDLRFLKRKIRVGEQV